MAKTYRVLIIDMYHYDEQDDFAIDGFPTLELAKEFARRWTRDSLEEQRRPGQTREALRQAWYAFGEDATVVGGYYTGFSELDFFIDRPASAEERDWKAIKTAAGLQ